MRTPKIVTTLQDYSRAAFAADVLAGVTVALVALPLSIAIAIASGADPAVGLVTAIVGGFLISALGGSRVQIGGPTGAFIVVVAGIIATYGYDGLVLATLMAGVILVVAALFRAGGLVAWVPEPVVDGFTVGIAVIIATSQLGDLFGLSVENLPVDFLEKIPVLWAARETMLPSALLLGVVSIVLILVFRRLAPRWPGLIVAVAAASLAAAVLGLPADTIQSRFGALPTSLPMPRLPEITLERMQELFPSALVIAFLAGVESLLSALVADRMMGGSHRPNAEVMAQGVANIGSALFAGLPATGAIARTATNVRAGGRTPVAGIVHACALLVVMLFAGPLVGLMVMPALAAILVVTAWNMSEPGHWRHRLSMRTSDKVLFVITLALTVLADLTVAIGVGTSIGLALRLRRRHVPPADWTPPDR